MTIANPYSFEAQSRVGAEGETALDLYFSRFYTLWPASTDQERKGIDRVSVHRLTGRTLTLQYKTDTRAQRTGNAFVETLSVVPHKPGWAVACAADYICYWVVGGDLYICPPSAIQQALVEWRQTCQSRRVPNRGYHTEGLLIPLPTFSDSAKIIIEDFKP
jgi:hypothetical protein